MKTGEDKDDENRPYLRKLGALLAAMIAGSCALFAYAVHGAMPYNPIKLPFETEIGARYWIPQGWKFFTKSPHDENMVLFTQGADGAWKSANLGPLALPSNVFGIARAVRAQGVESALILERVTRKAWAYCETDPTICLASLPVAGKVTNLSPRPSLCGTVGMVLQSPVPWAWASSTKKVTMPSSVVKLEVLC